MGRVTLNFNNKNLFRTLFAWVWVAIAFTVDMWYQYVPAKWITDGDLAGELLLSDLLNQEKKILSSNWFYTTELRVFETQWFYRLGLIIFPHNWHMARVLAAAMLTALLVCACIYFSKSVGLGMYGVWAAGFLIWPFGFWHLFLTIYGLYYMVYMILGLFTAGLIINFLKDKKIYRLPLAGILSLFAGTNGVRQLIVFFVPLSITSIIMLLLKIRDEKNLGILDIFKKYRSECSLFLVINASLIMNLLGYFINAAILSKEYHYYSYSDFTWGNVTANPVEALLDFLKLFGYVKDAEVVSLGGIASIFGVITALCLIFCTISLLATLKKYSFEKQIAIILFPIMVLFQLVVFAFLGNYSVNYWLPLICYAVVIFGIWFDEFKTFNEHLKMTLLVVLSIFIVFTSFATVKKEVTSPLRGKPGLLETSEWLADNGYTVVVASFWNANQITEFTNGQVEAYIADPNAKTGETWLQKTSHEELPEGDYIQIINKNSGEYIENYDSYPNATLVYSNSGIEAYYIE